MWVAREVFSENINTRMVISASTHMEGTWRGQMLVRWEGAAVEVKR